jgi:hypothetical protein
VRPPTRYRHLLIADALPAPSPEQVAAIEALLGATLPQSFRDFLRVANGGSVAYVIDVPTGNGKNEPLSFSGVFSANEGTFADDTFVGEIRSGREYAKIPVGVLPFACDGGGSTVYLDLTPEGRGRVVAFVHGLPEWAGGGTDSAFLALAASFDDYVGKLRIDRESVLDRLEGVSSEADLDRVEQWLDAGLPEWGNDATLAEAAREARRRLASGGGN